MKTGVSLWKCFKSFPYNTPGELNNTAITNHFRFAFEETLLGKSRDFPDFIVLKKLRMKHVFRPHGKKMRVFSNSSGLKSIFKKLRFSDRLVWTGGITVERKLRLQISSPKCGRSVNKKQTNRRVDI